MAEKTRGMVVKPILGGVIAFTASTQFPLKKYIGYMRFKAVNRHTRHILTSFTGTCIVSQTNDDHSPNLHAVNTPSTRILIALFKRTPF